MSFDANADGTFPGRPKTLGDPEPLDSMRMIMFSGLDSHLLCHALDLWKVLHAFPVKVGFLDHHGESYIKRPSCVE